MNSIDLQNIHLILSHNDADGGLAALTLRKAILEETGRVLPLCWSDYNSQVANNLHEIAVFNPHIYTVDVRLFPGVPGMDHHDSSQAWYDPAWHILDLSAPSCFSLMLDTVGERATWPADVVQNVDWMDSGSYPSPDLAVGLDSLGQKFIAIFTRFEFERVVAELWQNPDASAFVRRHREVLNEIRRVHQLLREDMIEHGWVEGRVAIWNSVHAVKIVGIPQRGINPFLLTAVYPEADYTIRIRPDGHMTIGHNPWAHPTAHIGALCETLKDPVTGVGGGGKAQVGGAPATDENVRTAIRSLNEA